MSRLCPLYTVYPVLPHRFTCSAIFAVGISLFFFAFFFFYCSGGKFCLLHLILSVLMFNPKTFWSEYLHDVTVKKSCLAGLFLCLCFMFLCFRIDYTSHMFITGPPKPSQGGPVSYFVGSIISVLDESPDGAFMPHLFGSVK